MIAAGGGAVTLRPGSTTGTWTSTAHGPEFALTEIVASWQAAAPGASWVETQLSVRMGSSWSPWFSMGRWAFDDQAIKRTSNPHQDNAFSFISVDTWFPHSGDSASAYHLRERLHGSADARPTIRQVAAVAFDSQQPSYHPSRTTMSRTVDLDAPGSQQLRSLPPDDVFNRHCRRDGAGDWAAIHTYDESYDGTGNWAFNTAYASHYGLDGSVRQYDSLVPLEDWVRRGVPAVVSIAWDNTSDNQRMHLDGADIDATGGHLIVVRGFTADGSVIANDPASPTNAAVRHVYRREQFEFRWQHASAGAVYLIKR